jgi:hypothetical protein
MNYLTKVVQIMMLLLLVRLWLLVIMLVAMMLTPPIPSHLLCSLSCLLWLQLLMSSTRTFPTTRLPCWQESSTLCTSFEGEEEVTQGLLQVW